MRGLFRYCRQPYFWRKPVRNQRSKFIVSIGILLLSIVLCAPMIEAGEKKVEKTVNINTATIDELAEIPLLTQELAQTIVEYREEVGDFQFIEELLLLDGIDEKLFSRIKSIFFLESIDGEDCGC